MPRSLARPSLAEVVGRPGNARTSTRSRMSYARVKGVTAALGSTLISEGLLSEDQLAHALAVQYGLPYDPLTDFRVDPRYYETISIKLMQRFPFVPIG